MDYLTIHVNKKFLLVMSLIIVYVGSVYGTYKYAYKHGGIDALEYVLKSLKSTEEGASMPQSDTAPMKPQSFYHPELDMQPGQYPYTEVRKI